MKPFLHILLILQVLLFPVASRATVVSGRVVDADSNPLPSATVRYFCGSDSVPEGAVLSDSEGGFKFTTQCSQIRITVSMTGMQPAEILTEASDSVCMTGNVVMLPQDHRLAEITVKAARRNLKSEAGGFSFDPKDFYTLATNAADLMRYVPLVETADNSMSILSKAGNALILINGFEPSYPQEVVMDKLRSMNPKDIKRIEIMMNPGARYGAGTLNSGVINIVLEDKYVGTFGVSSLTGYLSDSQLSGAAPTLTLFSQRHNFLTSISGGYSYQRGRTEDYSHYTDLQDGVITDQESHGTDRQQTARADITGEYNFKGGHSLALVLRYRGQELKNDLYGSTLKYPATETGINDNPLAEQYSRHVSGSPWTHALSAGIRYRKQFYGRIRSSLELSAGGQLNVRMRSNDRIDVSPAPDFSILSERYDQSNEDEMTYRSATADYRMFFPQGTKVRISGNLNYTSQNQDYTAPANRWNFRLGNLKQAYSQEAEHRFCDVFSARAGLREEIATRDVRLGENGGQTTRTTFFWLLPNISLSFQFAAGRHNLNLDWSSRTSSSYASVLNPYRKWLNSTEYYTGNPALRPERTDTWEIRYTGFGRLFLSAGFSRGRDCLTETVYVDNEGYIARSYSPDARYGNFNFLASWQKGFFGWRWQMGLKAQLGLRHYSGMVDGMRMRNNSLFWLASWSNEIAIDRRHDFRGSAAVNISGGEKTLTRSVSTSGRINLGLTKGLWKDAEISGFLSIPLNNSTTTFSTPQLTQTLTRKYGRTVSAQLAFSWLFGKRSIQRVEAIDF